MLFVLRRFWNKRVIRIFLRWLHTLYHDLFIRPEKYFVLALLLIACYFFFGQFFGNSFYAPAYEEFQDSELVSGSSPLIIFVNLIINYTTSVSPFFIFSLCGFLFLLFKKNKRFDDWFLVFSFIGFCGVLLDKQYTKMFVTPLLAILGSYASVKLFYLLQQKIMYKRFLSVISFSLTILIFMSVILSLFRLVKLYLFIG